MMSHRVLVAATLVSLVGAEALAQTQPSRVRVMKRDSTERDSLPRQMRITVEGVPVEQMMRQLMSTRAMEETVALALREAASSDRADQVRVTQLQRELESIARRSAGLATAIRMQCTRPSEPQPDGYMGVTFEQTMISRNNDEPAVYQLGVRPTIASVEPGSPADKAGLRAGDLVVTIGGEDAHRLKLEAILKPGARVPVRVQRDGVPKEIAVIVGKRPESYGGTTCSSVDEIVGPDAPQVRTFTVRPGVPMVRVPVPARMPDEGIPANGFGFAFMTPTMSTFGGATVVPVDDGWRESLGVERGIVVTSVARNSPAYESGLRSADVILSVDDTPVSNVAQVLRAVSASESRTVKLSVVRQRKPTTITFRMTRTVERKSPPG
jgi:predicted metalloprotease with PDZ domain